MRSLVVATTAIALAVTAAPALATTDRADYVTQVDQICSGSPRDSGRFGPRLKTLFGPKQAGRVRNRFINRIARILATFNNQFSSTTERIALVPPAPGDETAVAQWIDGLRRYATFTAESIRAFRHHKPRAALAWQRQATNALNAGGAAVQGFGISVCTTSLPTTPV